jgi:hypothetical protein
MRRTCVHCFVLFSALERGHHAVGFGALHVRLHLLLAPQSGAVQKHFPALLHDHTSIYIHTFIYIIGMKYVSPTS